jgi:hypothetical protein
MSSTGRAKIHIVGEEEECRLTFILSLQARKVRGWMEMEIGRREEAGLI